MNDKADPYVVYDEQIRSERLDKMQQEIEELENEVDQLTEHYERQLEINDHQGAELAEVRQRLHDLESLALGRLLHALWVPRARH